MDIKGIGTLTGAILAAGRGTRARPYTSVCPKPLLEIEGFRVIESSITIMRDKLGISEICIVVNHLGNRIKDFLGNGERYGVSFNFVDITEEQLDEGIIGGLKALRPHVGDAFVVMLGDELYIDSDHDKMLSFLENAGDWDMALMYNETLRISEIRKNYSLEFDGHWVTSVKEKPEQIVNDFMGLGTFVFSKEIFELIKDHHRQGQHLVDFINTCIEKGLKVLGFRSGCKYVNINDRYDFKYAKYTYRNERFDDYKISVVIPAYNEAGSIKYVVKDFIDRVDEVLVVDNVSADGTANIARQAGAKVISMPLKGYGDALRRGIAAASGEIIVLTEADGTFIGKDIDYLVPLLRDTDAVFGSRTHREFIGINANMGLLLRTGNRLFGYIITLLWYDRRCHFTDVGCTYRAFWKSTYDQIEDRLIGVGPEFSPELMVEFVNAYMRVLEIPVNYLERCLGESKFSKSLLHNAHTALKMLKLILIKRVRSWWSNLLFLFRAERA